RGAVGPEEPVQERGQGDALRGGPGGRAMRPAAQVGVIPQVGLATDRLGPLEELPAGRGCRLLGRGRLCWLLLGGTGPGPVQRRFPAALALLLVGHGGGPPSSASAGKACRYISSKVWSTQASIAASSSSVNGRHRGLSLPCWLRKSIARERPDWTSRGFQS